MPKIKIFFSFKYLLWRLIDLLNRPILPIKLSDVKKIIGWLYGISFIRADDNMAEAVFFLNGSKIILYFLILYFEVASIIFKVPKRFE